MAQKRMGLLVSHNVERSLREHARKHLRGTLIDIGCGTKPYADLLAPLVEQHVGLDHAGCCHDQSKIDLTGSAYEIPAEDGGEFRLRPLAMEGVGAHQVHVLLGDSGVSQLLQYCLDGEAPDRPEGGHGGIVEGYEDAGPRMHKVVDAGQAQRPGQRLAA